MVAVVCVHYLASHIVKLFFITLLSFNSTNTIYVKPCLRHKNNAFLIHKFK